MKGKYKAIKRIFSVLVALLLVVVGFPVLENEITTIAYGASIGVSSVTVKVTLDGVPQSNKWVYLYENDFYKDQKITNSQGDVTFTNMANGAEYYFSVNGRDEEYKEYNGKDLGKIFVFPAGPVEDIQLLPLHTITANVVLNGKPAQGVWVTLKNDNQNFSQSRYIYSPGQISFSSVPEGSGYYFTVEQTPNNMAYDGLILGKSFAVPGTIPTIELDSGNVVTATVSIGGEPIAYKRVELRNEFDGSFYRSTSTDANGTLTLSTIPDGSGYYFVVNETVDHIEYNGKSLGKTFSVPGTAPAIELDVGNQASIIIMLNGLPVKGAQVYLYRYNLGQKRSEYIGNAVSDGNGMVKFNTLEAGHSYYLFVYRGEGYTEYDGFEKNHFFSVPGPVETVELDIGYTVTSKVTLGGVPQYGARVSVYNNEKNEYESFDYTDYDGNVSISGLPAGEYYFRVDADEQYIAYDGKVEGKIFAVPGNAPTIELNPGNQITTTVTFEGIPQSRVKVDLYRGVIRPQLIRSDYYTDNDGQVTFKGLPNSDNYFFSVEAMTHDPYASYNGQIAGKLFRIPGTVPSIELEPANQVSTTVTLNGQSINTKVTLWKSSNTGRDYELASSWGYYNGSVTFNNIPMLDDCYFTVERSIGNYAAYDGKELGKLFTIGGDIPSIELDVGYTVSTQVTLNSVPVEDARVYLYPENRNTYTDSNGQVTFQNVAGRDGNYFQVSYNAGNYAEYIGTIEEQVFSLPGQVPNIQLQTGEDFSVKFTYKSIPVVDWEVNIDLITSEKLYAITYGYTDENGSITFSNILPGFTYSFFVSDPDYLEWYESKEVVFVPGQTPTIELFESSDNGGGNSGNKGGGGGGGGSRRDADRTATATTLVKTASISEKTLTDKTLQAVTKATQNGNTSAVVSLKNIDEVSLAALKAMVKAANNTPVLLRSSSIHQNKVDVRVTIDPAKAEKALSLYASTVSDSAGAVKKKFEKHYGNALNVIAFNQKGSFGQNAQIAFKSDGLDNSNLHFYHYNPETNRVVNMNVSYTVDGSGYVHFKTDTADAIVITDKPLAKR